MVPLPFDYWPLFFHDSGHRPFRSVPGLVCTAVRDRKTARPWRSTKSQGAADLPAGARSRPLHHRTREAPQRNSGTMEYEIDHPFVLTDVEASDADALMRFGLTEGPPNRHAGQGTANRRFFFDNAMLELLCVESEDEARSLPAQPSRLADQSSAQIEVQVKRILHLCRAGSFN
jgi:hypothetical protein